MQFSSPLGYRTLDPVLQHEEFRIGKKRGADFIRRLMVFSLKRD
jgi:hypothetical protein